MAYTTACTTVQAVINCCGPVVLNNSYVDAFTIQRCFGWLIAVAFFPFPVLKLVLRTLTSRNITSYVEYLISTECLSHSLKSLASLSSFIFEFTQKGTTVIRTKKQVHGNTNCPHIEMKLKQNGFKTVSKLFCFSFISVCRRLKQSINTVGLTICTWKHAEDY